MRTNLKFVILTIIFSLFLNISVSATNKSEYVFEYDNKTIVIENNLVDYEKATMIADSLHYGASENSNYGIACIFGHKLSTTTVVETIHKVRTSGPRCDRSTYQVNYCTRSSCNYSEVTLISTIYVYCCE